MKLNLDENLFNENTKKKADGKWVNKGSEGEHGEFKTKKEADAQRKAMFANGFHEDLEESAEIITPRERKTSIEYELFYQRKNAPDYSGFAFPCDEDGNFDKLAPEAQKSYNYVQNHLDEFEEPIIEKNEHSYTENAIAKCSHCGNEFELWDEYLGACECPKCGQWYNLFGQELKNPNNWGDID